MNRIVQDIQQNSKKSADTVSTIACLLLTMQEKQTVHEACLGRLDEQSQSTVQAVMSLSAMLGKHQALLELIAKQVADCCKDCKEISSQLKALSESKSELDKPVRSRRERVNA